MKSHKSTKGSGYNLPQNLSQKLLHEFIEGSIMGSADSVLDDIMATQREKIKKSIPTRSPHLPPKKDAGRHGIVERMESTEISKHKLKINCWIS